MEPLNSYGFLADNQQARLVSREEYLQFLQTHDSVLIDAARVPLVKNWQIEELHPTDYRLQETTVWSFPDRGTWATHVGNYPGNWSPFVPRNLIARYTQPGDVVCDPMMGSGTALVECKLMRRNAIGVDINYDACMITMNRLDFKYPSAHEDDGMVDVLVYLGDVRNLDKVDSNTIDLVATHPPYANMKAYSERRTPKDLSALDIDDFVVEMGKAATECFRILKPNKHCAILIGDTRRNQHYVPIHIGVLNKFLEAGFVLKEDVIKIQHGMSSALKKWSGHDYTFFKIAHEHLYIFRKPDHDETTPRLEHSKKWW